ncbi:helix-turn-helix domain-containing protein [Pseudochrobactrum asaccharolyticum]|uniref:helix-turn-helix domain-containing protein n=1 Tax=Pseudochrobactrum asaccharolyticum TaxID=354351 RepID=UPI0040416201
MINHFGDLLAFVKVADSQSFTQTAERLGMSRSAVGKCIARLEENLAPVWCIAPPVLCV